MSDSEEYIDFQLYRYDPNLAAAVIFVVLFVLTTVCHLYQLIKSRSWYFIAFVLGGICECFSTWGSAFPMASFEYTVLIMMNYSPDNWIYSTGCGTFEHREYTNLFNPNNPHLIGAPAICCIDLYGSWQIDSISSRRKFQYSTHKMDDRHFRDW